MPELLNMEYNSEKDLLVIPEYGRNVQMLIQHAKTIEDKDYRQAFVERLVRLMHQMHPQNKNIDDYKDKLWNHIFLISNYELGVTPPDGINPTPENLHKKPERVPYPDSFPEFRHYGNNVHKLIQKALSMEEGPKKKGFIAVIGNYMKLAYRTWNKEHYVSDEVIKSDLESLSKGKLILEDDAVLDNLTSANRKRRRNSNGHQSSRDKDSRGRKGHYHRKRK